MDDPHLWERARPLGLDLERFNRERRSATVAERVRRDFESGIRAGVTGTPAAFVAGQASARTSRIAAHGGARVSPVGHSRGICKIVAVREREF